MGFLKVLGNNNCTISQNGFIIVKGTIEVITSLVTTSSTSASEFENFTTSDNISDNTFIFDNSDVFVLEDGTDYKSVTLSNNKIKFINDNYIELPSEINNSTTKLTRKDIENSIYYLLYKDVSNGLYDLLVIFDCANSTIQVKQLYHEQQLGSDIDGEEDGDKSGYSVSLSSDGTIVAIGATRNNGSGSDSGHVRVYKYNGTTWSQLGSDIDGEAKYDASGTSVSLSSGGTIVAIGSEYNNGNGADSGHVRVYKWRQYTQDDEDAETYEYKSSTQNSTQTKPLIITEDTSSAPDVGSSYWTQLGSDIDGEARDDYSGSSVSLSSDGTIVAIGAVWNNGVNGEYSGHVRVYEYDSVDGWSQLGSDIDGEATDDESGSSVSLSGDGTIVAIGAEYNNGNGTYSGHVRVYEYKNGSWTQLGSDIDGAADNNYSGSSVSLSSDGTIVAIGEYGNNSNKGHVRVYQRDTDNTTTQPYGWSQLGSDIDGEADGDLSGKSVSLSGDGTIVAIGAPNNDENGSNSGHVRVYKYDSVNDSWVKIYKDIDGENAGDKSGWNVSLSSDGSTIAIGAYLNDGNGEDSGHTRVYNLPSNSIKETSSNTISSSTYVTIR